MQGFPSKPNSSGCQFFLCKGVPPFVPAPPPPFHGYCACAFYDEQTLFLINFIAKIALNFSPNSRIGMAKFKEATL
jgi:hypothetical protein